MPLHHSLCPPYTPHPVNHTTPPIPYTHENTLLPCESLHQRRGAFAPSKNPACCAETRSDHIPSGCSPPPPPLNEHAPGQTKTQHLTEPQASAARLFDSIRNGLSVFVTSITRFTRTPLKMATWLDQHVKTRVIPGRSGPSCRYGQHARSIMARSDPTPTTGRIYRSNQPLSPTRISLQYRIGPYTE